MQMIDDNGISIQKYTVIQSQYYYQYHLLSLSVEQIEVLIMYLLMHTTMHSDQTNPTDTLPDLCCYGHL